jgi:hypothetical protein
VPARSDEVILPDEVQQFVHLFLHVKARKQGWEPALVQDCWGFFEDLPESVLEMAASGKPGTYWCPELRPSLRGAG